jgi:hypothetical protein
VQPIPEPTYTPAEPIQEAPAPAPVQEAPVEAPAPVTETPAEPAPQPVPEPAPAIEQPAPVEAPAPAPRPGGIDESVVANAIDKLLAKTAPATSAPAPTGDTPTPAPAPVANTTPADATNPPIQADPAGQSNAPELPHTPNRIHNKVIQPISGGEQKPSLEELLAKEEAKEAGLPGTAGQQIAAPSPSPTTPPGVDPNSIAL